MECIKNTGEKGRPHLEYNEAPHQHANKRRGHGNWYTDRPPVTGVIGRQSSQVAVAVKRASSKTDIQAVVEVATTGKAVVSTDKWRCYNRLKPTQDTYLMLCPKPTG